MESGHLLEQRPGGQHKESGHLLEQRPGGQQNESGEGVKGHSGIRNGPSAYPWGAFMGNRLRAAQRMGSREWKAMEGRDRCAT